MDRSPPLDDGDGMGKEGEFDLFPTTELSNFDEKDLLRELAELTGQQVDLEENGDGKSGEGMPAPLPGLRAIRTGPVSLGDYNVENVQLTAEDEQDPTLLGELASLAINKHASDAGTMPFGETVTEGATTGEGPLEGRASVDQASSRDSSGPVDEIQMLKQLALEAKRSGDMEMARELMLQIKQLTQQGRDTIDETEPTAACTPRSAHFVEAAALPRTKVLQRRLLSQAQTCREVAKAQLAAGDSRTAAEFVRRERALMADLAMVRGLGPGAPTPATTVIPIEVPMDNTNKMVGEDCLQIKLRPQLRASGGVSSREGAQRFIYTIVTTLEWPPARESVQAGDAPPPVHRQQTEKFKLTEERELCLTYGGIKRDLRAAKFFEHHKLKLELLREEEGGIGSLASLLLGRPKQVPVGQTTVRMTPLVSVGRLSEGRLEFVEGGSRKGTGIVVSLDMLVRRPLSPKAAFSMKRTVEWTVLCNGNFFKGPEGGETSSPPGEEALPPTASMADSTAVAAEEVETLTREAEERAKEILSYAVLEDEVAKTRSDPTSATDPRQLAWLMALEAALDRMTMAVDLGTLGMDEYLERLRSQAIPRAKQQALAAKRAGCLDQARRHLQHLRLMEGELAEATADGNSEDAAADDGAGDKTE